MYVYVCVSLRKCSTLIMPVLNNTFASGESVLTASASALVLASHCSNNIELSERPMKPAT